MEKVLLRLCTILTAYRDGLIMEQEAIDGVKETLSAIFIILDREEG